MRFSALSIAENFLKINNYGAFWKLQVDSKSTTEYNTTNDCCKRGKLQKGEKPWQTQT